MIIKSKFIKKILKLVRSWKKKDTNTLNKHDRKLSEKKIVVNLDGLDAERETIVISGNILVYGDFFDKAVIFAVNFFDKTNKKLVINSARQSFSVSQKYGYYRYLPASRAGAPFDIMLALPPSCHRVKIEILPKSGVPAILQGGATLHRLKSSDADKFTAAIKEIANIEAGISEYEKYADPAMYAPALKRILDQNNAADLARLFDYLDDTKQLSAPGIARLLYNENKDLAIAKKALVSLTEFGHLVAMNDFIVDVNKAPPVGWTQTNRRVSDDVERLRHGYDTPTKQARAYEPTNNTLYLLHNSLPYNSGGYATRTHGLLTGIAHVSKYLPNAVSRPGFPTDHQKHISKPLPSVIPEHETIDEISYYRCDQDVRRSRLTSSEYIDVFADDVKKIALKTRAAVIHAASNYPNGMAAVRAASALGVPSVYEVRGLWEITRMSRQSYWDRTDIFRLMAQSEAEACMQADQVLTITKALKDLMISRGVDGDKITVVPNCVHTDLFIPNPIKDEELLRNLGYNNDDVVIGYIGSVVNYEGLKDLLSAVAILRDKNITGFKVLIVGDGGVLGDLQTQSIALSLQDIVTFTGRVPHSEVPRYYSLVDITPFPREPFLVCELVSPLKPFEALASQKAVLVSSCAALTEIISDHENGRVFEKGNVIDFAAKLEELIFDRDQRDRLSKRGREWVVSERDWRNSSSIVAKVYDSLT